MSGAAASVGFVGAVGGGCTRRRLCPEEFVCWGVFGREVSSCGFAFGVGFSFRAAGPGVFFYTAFLLSFSVPSSSLKLRPSRAFIGSPTHPRLKDHLRCLIAADAGRTGAQLPDDERSGSFWQDQRASE
jgi:hypothetical protein